MQNQCCAYFQQSTQPRTSTHRCAADGFQNMPSTKPEQSQTGRAQNKEENRLTAAVR
jgi:hypothetical protein